jgi:hypothetical protein
VEVFNVSEYRRKLYGAIKDAEWFDPSNVAAVEMRDNCNIKAIEDMMLFLELNSNGIAIFDSVNDTFEKRHNLLIKVSFMLFNNVVDC